MMMAGNWIAQMRPVWEFNMELWIANPTFITSPLTLPFSTTQHFVRSSTCAARVIKSDQRLSRHRLNVRQGLTNCQLATTRKDIIGCLQCNALTGKHSIVEKVNETTQLQIGNEMDIRLVKIPREKGYSKSMSSKWRNWCWQSDSNSGLPGLMHNRVCVVAFVRGTYRYITHYPEGPTLRWLTKTLRLFIPRAFGEVQVSGSLKLSLNQSNLRWR